MNFRFLLLILLIVQLQPVAIAQNISVGIGTNTPLSPLDLGPVSGNRMIFWGEGNQTHYGIGSQNGNMQIYANLAVDNIGFGLGRSSAFAENLHISGNGMVGIYNLSPAYRLDINGRLKLSGIDSIVNVEIDYTSNQLIISNRLQLAPQLFLNNSNNSAAVAKIGASERFINRGAFDFRVEHFFGIHSAGNNILRLGMLQTDDAFNNTRSYALAINGSSGEPGQILRSRGLNSGANWTNTIQRELHNELYNAYGYNLTLNNTLQQITLERDIPASDGGDYMDNTYNLKTPSKLLIKFRISANNLSNSCILCGPSIFDIVVTDNGNIFRTFRYTIPVNTSDTHLTGSAILDLPIGSHQIKLGGYMISGPNVSLGVLIGAPINTYTTDGVKMIVEIIPSFK
jgi:hypothetical protein